MSSSISYGSRFTSVSYLASELAKFQLPIDEVVTTMYNTSMVLSGGFAVNQLLHMTGRDFPTAPASDIDFFVYGGIKPNRDDYSDNTEYYARLHKERVFQSMVLAQFKAMIEPHGYLELMLEESEYDVENTKDGDRIFTSGSNVRLNVRTFGRYEDGVVMNKLNLVFSDTPIPLLMRKVDISLTAGFMYASWNDPECIVYEHCFPDHINKLELHWVQETSTRTPRQIARWQKYKERYNILDKRTMTANEFITSYDTLPDKLHITIVGTQAQLASRPVTRRMAGLPYSKFELHPIQIPQISIPVLNRDVWDEPARDPGAPRNRLIDPEDDDDETVLAQPAYELNTDASTIHSEHSEHSSPRYYNEW